MKKVVVLGGGVAGLSAAHELVKRGYEVHVFESGGDVGGKASSQAVPHTAAGGRRDLPGEHGFRFYPSFYRHLIRTMEEIPAEPGKRGGPSVADRLEACNEAGVALADGGGVRRFLRRKPRDAFDLAAALRMFVEDLGVGLGDAGRFGKRILRYFASCDRRRLDEYEKISWWEYLDGDSYSPAFQRQLRAIPRIMVAMDPRAGSARTIGNISMQLLEDYAKEGVNNDRTLVGPTTEVWIAPWRAHLEALGARFHTGKRLVGLDFDPASQRISGARVEGEAEPVLADHYLLAVPLEVAVEVVTDEMAGRCGELAKLCEIREKRLADSSAVTSPVTGKMTDWMVGIQFYLREDVPLVRGHVFYPDSPWALSSISQAQFWASSPEGRFRGRYGDGAVGGVLSVDISDWNREGVFIERPAKRCSREEIKTEVWEQLKAGLNSRAKAELTDDLLYAWHLDDNIEFAAGHEAAPKNRSPLLVHPPSSWWLRPSAATGIENLTLASDYVQTETILACMEGANEGARHAVNAILDRDGYRGGSGGGSSGGGGGGGGDRCEVWRLRENRIFDGPKRADDLFFGRRGAKAPEPMTRLFTDDPADRTVDLDEIEKLQSDLATLGR